jgi:hypothetical protein
VVRSKFRIRINLRSSRNGPSLPPDCVRREVLSLPNEEVDMTNRLNWMSRFIFGTLRTGFVVTLVFFCGCDGDIVVCCEKVAEEEALAECRKEGKEQRGDGIGHTELYYISILGCDF